MVRTLNKWFEQPTVQIQKNSEELVERLDEIMKQKIETDAAYARPIGQPEEGRETGQTGYGKKTQKKPPTKSLSLRSSVGSTAAARVPESRP